MNLVVAWSLFGRYQHQKRRIKTKIRKERKAKNIVISTFFSNFKRLQNPGIQIRNQQVSGSSPLTSSTGTRMNTTFVRVLVLPRHPSNPILVVIWSLFPQKHTKRYRQIGFSNYLSVVAYISIFTIPFGKTTTPALFPPYQAH